MCVDGECEQKGNVLVYEALLVNRCLQRWGLGCLVTRFLRDQKKQASLERQSRGTAEGGLNRAIFRETYSFVWLRWTDSQVTWPPAPPTPVQTAGVAVGNRGETLGREQSGQRRKEKKKKKPTRLKKATSPVWGLFKTSEFTGMTSNWQGLLASGH